MINYAMYEAARNGNRKLVKWLQARGGDVFWAVVGAAGYSVNSDLYDELVREADVSYDRGPTRNDYLLGASMVANQSLFRALLTKAEIGGNELFDELLLREGGHYRIVKGIYLQAVPSSSRYQELLSSLARKLNIPEADSAASRWYIEGAFSAGLITKDPLEFDLYFNSGAAGAGYGGHFLSILYLIEEMKAKKARELKDQSNPEFYKLITGQMKLTILSCAADSAALKGDIKMVKELEAQGAFPLPSSQSFQNVGFILMAARGGHIALLNKFSDLINKLSEKDPNIYRQIMVEFDLEGFINGNAEDTLRVASFIDNPKLRERFISDASEKNDSLDEKYLFRKASLLNRFMKEHDLNYNQAFAWNSPELRTWLLGQDGSHSLPIDLVRYIASFVVPLTEPEVIDLAQKLEVASQKYKKALENRAKFNYGEPEQDQKGKKQEAQLKQVGGIIGEEKQEAKPEQSGQDEKGPKP
jgi:hypothetical protein